MNKTILNALITNLELYHADKAMSSDEIVYWDTIKWNLNTGKYDHAMKVFAKLVNPCTLENMFINAVRALSNLNSK